MLDWFINNAIDLIGLALTVISVVVGALIIVWQIGRQHRNSILLQRDNAKEELKLRIYEILIEKIENLSRASASAEVYARMIPFDIENFKEQTNQGLNPPPAKKRARELASLNNEVSESFTRMLEDFESWSIAFPGLKVFQVALNSAIYDAGKAFFPLYTEVLNFLPMESPETSPPNSPAILVPRLPTQEELINIKTLAEEYCSSLNDIGCYALDLKVEAQNNLLSGLFESKVPLRQPLDPDAFVISTEPDKIDGLIEYFENETAWGKENIKIEIELMKTYEEIERSEQQH